MSESSNGSIRTAVIRSVQRFFEISPIHGCSYVGFRAAFYEAIIWASLLIICTCLCVNDIISLSNKYASEQTAVLVVTHTNDTLSFTTASICFDVFRFQLAQSINSSFIEGEFNASLKMFSQMIEITPDLSLLPINDTNIDMILKTTYLLLAAIVDYDIGIPGASMIPYSSQTQRAIEIVDTFYQAHGFSYSQLYEQTARYMCKQVIGSSSGSCAIQDAGMYKQTCLDICGSANITWLGFTLVFSLDDICFALNTDLAVVFKTAEDTFTFEGLEVSRMSLLVSQWGESNTILSSGYGTPKLVFDMRGWIGMMDPRATDSVSTVSEGTSVLLGVQVDSQFKAYNHSNGTCGAVSAGECALYSCLVAARMQADGCWPLAGYTLTSAKKPLLTKPCNIRFSEGEISQINNLGATNAYTSAWETCLLRNCSLAPCYTMEYEYMSSISSMGTGVNATLYQGRMNYPVFVEYVLMDSASYLATFGGILGLWLGGSLISIVHVPVFIVCAVINKFRKSTNPPSVADVDPLTSLALRSTVQLDALQQREAEVQKTELTYL